MRARPLARDEQGATVVEFAIVAPMLLLFILGIMEAGWAVWNWQVAQETAYATARCAAIGDPQCADADQAKQFAVGHARRSGITLPTSGITVEKGVQCDGFSDMDRISLSYPYGPISGGLIPAMPRQIISAACMPAM